MTRYGILPQAQQTLLSPLSPLKDLGSCSTGYGDRHADRPSSIDFDFFSDRSVARRHMLEVLPLLRNGETLQDEADTWTVRATPTPEGAGVKLSFFTDLGFGRVGTPVLDDRGDLLLASLDDLLGHKLKVLFQRVEAKDYLDIAAMLDGGQTLRAGLGAALALFPNLPP